MTEMQLTIKVIPRAGEDRIVGFMSDGTLKIKIKAPPTDMQANSYLIDYLAKVLEIKKVQLELLSGHTGRLKRVRLKDISSDEAVRKINALI